MIDYLLTCFDYLPENEMHRSKKRRLGLSTGDDAFLFIDLEVGVIWWRSDSGYERTIFDGAPIKTEKEIKQVFKLLGLNQYRIFYGI